MVSQFPSPAQDYQQTQIDLNTELVKDPAATYVLRVYGEAMEGAGIFDGDDIIVDTSIKPRPGQIVVAFLDDEFMVKRLKVDQHGAGWLLPENPRVCPIPIPTESEFHIFGVVTRCLRRLAPAS